MMSYSHALDLAGIAGAVAAVFGSPFYLVKTQQQAQSQIAGVGHQVLMHLTSIPNSSLASISTSQPCKRFKT